MITCSYPSSYVCAGEAIVCLIKGRNSGADFANAIIFAHVHGHISVDYRWLKTEKRITDTIVEPPGPFVDSYVYPVADPMPLAQHHTSACIFSSSRCTLSPSHIFGSGTFIEFEIPRGSLPTFRGLCASVHYFVTLTVQFQDGTEVHHYPMTVQSSGTTIDPYHVRHASMVAYPVAALPEEVFLSLPAIGSRAARPTDEDSVEQLQREVPNVYMIRDKEHICNLRLPSKHGLVGRELVIELDFAECLQECSLVRAALVVSEVRPDGTRVQEKVISTTTKTATDAEWLDLSVLVPLGTGCTFSTPLFQVCYHLDVEFCLDSTDLAAKSGAYNKQGASAPVDALDEAFSFSVPIQVYQVGQPRVPAMEGKVDKVEPSHTATAYVQQQALRCLESTNVVRPIQW